jgi:hypothetical protein|tara:strand:+ start:566 stop:916 length:351 start_codon:yes stop_codon:yes gene_type:complete
MVITALAAAAVLDAHREQAHMGGAAAAALEYGVLAVVALAVHLTMLAAVAAPVDKQGEEVLLIRLVPAGDLAAAVAALDQTGIIAHRVLLAQFVLFGPGQTVPSQAQTLGIINVSP